MTGILEILRTYMGAPICHECAISNGGVWPEDHIATCWVGRCDVCETEQNCSAVSDYRWPRGMIEAARVTGTNGR